MGTFSHVRPRGDREESLGWGGGSVQGDPPEGARSFLHLSLFTELRRTGANLVYWIRFLSPRRETK